MNDDKVTCPEVYKTPEEIEAAEAYLANLRSMLWGGFAEMMGFASDDTEEGSQGKEQ